MNKSSQPCVYYLYIFHACYRTLEHSTIVYEAPPAPVSPSGSFASAISDGSRPLLRVQFNRLAPELLATFHMDSDTVQILDIRYPSAPVFELVRSHQSSVNCFSWSPRHPGYICTGGKRKSHNSLPAFSYLDTYCICSIGDDAQVLVWDIEQQQPTQQRHPSTSLNSRGLPQPSLVQSPSLRYLAESEVKSLSWSQSLPMWIGIGFGRTIQALKV